MTQNEFVGQVVTTAVLSVWWFGLVTGFIWLIWMNLQPSDWVPQLRRYRRYRSLIVLVLSAIVLIGGTLGFYFQTSGVPTTEAATRPPDLPPADANADKPGETVSEGAPTRETRFSDWSLYRAAQLFLLNSGDDGGDSLFLVLARDAAAALVLLLALEVVHQLFRDSILAMRLRRAKEHFVICGLGRTGIQIVEDLLSESKLEQFAVKALGYRLGRRRRNTVVVITRNAAKPLVQIAREKGAIILIGDATDELLLSYAGAHRAAEVFFVTGDDGKNLEGAAQLWNLREREKSEHKREFHTTCYVHLADQCLSRLMASLPDRCDKGQLRTFDALTTSALSLVRFELIRHKPQPEQVAHYVILGFGEIGPAVVRAIAEQAHFANGKRSRLTILYEPQDALSVQAFQARHPRFCKPNPEWFRGWDFPSEWDEWGYSPQGYPQSEKGGVSFVCNAAFLPFPADYRDLALVNHLERLARKPESRCVIIACHSDDERNVALSVHLNEELLRRKAPLPIFVSIAVQHHLAELVEKRYPMGDRANTFPQGEVVPFGQCKNSCDHEEIVGDELTTIAKVVYRSYEALQAENAAKKGKTHESLPWERLRWEFQQSNLQAARHVAIKLDALGLSLNPDNQVQGAIDQRLQEFDENVGDLQATVSRMEHNRWMAERLMSGWTFAEVSQNERRTRDSLAAWEKLKDYDRQKDRRQIHDVLDYYRRRNSGGR